MNQVRSFKISQNQTEIALNLAAERLNRIGCHSLKERSSRAVRWKDRGGIFHTCEISFSARHDKEKGYIDVNHCGHFDYTVDFFGNDLAKHGLNINNAN